MDAFSAQIVKFVREMPDEALLELVKQKLGVIGAAAASKARKDGSTARAVVTATANKAKSKANHGDRRKAPASTRSAISPDRQTVLEGVERVVKAGQGVSASEVAKAAGVPQTRAAAALKELKLAKRIFQGGDRRFARYAGDQKTADSASAFARKTAKGPIVRPKPNARSKKRAPSASGPAPAAAPAAAA